MASVDMYLNIDGIKGESLDDKHKDWIEVLHYSHTMTQPVSSTKSSAGGASTGRTTHGDLYITKYIDVSSPALAAAVTNGKHFDKATFEICRAGGTQVPFSTITLGQVIVSKVQHNGPQNVGGAAGDLENPGAGVGSGTGTSSLLTNADVLPTETIALNYGTIEWKYTQQKRTDGSGGGSTTTKADLTKGTTA